MERSCDECSSSHQEWGGKVRVALLPDNAEPEFAAGIDDPKRLESQYLISPNR